MIQFENNHTNLKCSEKFHDKLFFKKVLTIFHNLIHASLVCESVIILWKKVKLNYFYFFVDTELQYDTCSTKPAIYTDARARAYHLAN